MFKISLKLKELSYLPYLEDNYPLYVLGVFLLSDVGGTGGFESFYNWIKDSTRTGISCNIAGLDKIGDKIHMYLFFDDDLYEEDPEKYSLTISINEFTHVLEDWYELLKLKPPYIIITEENGKYSLEAANEPHAIIE